MILEVENDHLGVKKGPELVFRVSSKKAISEKKLKKAFFSKKEGF